MDAAKPTSGRAQAAEASGRRDFAITPQIRDWPGVTRGPATASGAYDTCAVALHLAAYIYIIYIYRL